MLFLDVLPRGKHLLQPVYWKQHSTPHRFRTPWKACLGWTAISRLQFRCRANSEKAAVTKAGKKPWLAASLEMKGQCLPYDPCWAAGDVLNPSCTTQVSELQNSLYCCESTLKNEENSWIQTILMYTQESSQADVITAHFKTSYF